MSGPTWAHRIPSRLVRFWHDGANVPEPVRTALERNAATHEGYEHVLADDAFVIDLMERRYGADAVDLYVTNAIPASRSDVARLILLLEYGGFYVDARLETAGPIHERIPPETELAVGRYAGVIANGILAAIPGHPVLRRALDLALRNLRKGYFNHNVIHATGSRCIQVALETLGEPPKLHWMPYRGVIRHRHEDADLLGAATLRWRLAQYEGIRPTGANSRGGSSMADEVEAHTPAAREDEADYIDDLPLDLGLGPTFTAEAEAALNRWLTGRSETRWMDDLASRGPFPHVAVFTLGATPVEAAFLRAVAAERLTLVSPKRRLLEVLAARLAVEAPWLEVEAIHHPLDRPALPEDAFDLVYSQACLHRLIDVDATLAAIAASLRPGGLFAFVEYKGEDRLQFSSRRLAHARQLLTELLAASRLATDTVLSAPSPTEFGPFGAARSSRLVPAARARFEERHYADCVVAALPLFLISYLGLLDALPTVIAREDALRAAGEEGTLAYGVYAKAPRSRDSAP